MSVFISFGEIMCRLAAPEHLRLRQTRTLDVTYAGAEASVAASICNFGGQARYLTALPRHALAEATLDSLRAVGIDTSHVVRTDEGRLGVYFLETGANQRPSNVIYDREHSAIAITPPDQYNWDAAFEGADWLHLSGITPALSQNATEATRAAAVRARESGLTVSLDLNFRSKLWRWDGERSPHDLARRTMRTILPHVDVVIANEEDCQDILDIRAAGADVHSGSLNTTKYPDVAKQVVEQFPNVSRVAITLRESLSATHNNWGAMLYESKSGQAFFGPSTADGSYRPYEIKHIVDRVGGGDSFAGGLIYALRTPELATPESAVSYAAAASCLKHSIKGDFNFSTRPEVEALMHGSGSGRVVR